MRSIMSPWLAAVLVFFIFVGLPVTYSFLLKLARVLKGSEESGMAPGEEVKNIQEMNRQLGALEERIESLETILMKGNKEEKET